MVWSLEKILRGARNLNASDIHLMRGYLPWCGSTAKSSSSTANR